MPAYVEPSGYSEWWQEGKPARLSGGPNIVDYDGTQEWTDEKMRRHRDGDLPALIKPGGIQCWYRHGVPHRDGNKPAIIDAQGRPLRYFKNGALHREDGPALIDYRSGVQEWYLDDRKLDAAEIRALQAKTSTHPQRKPPPKP